MTVLLKIISIVLLFSPLLAWTESPGSLQGNGSMEKYKKPNAEELKSLLTSEQFYITQKNGTERPFENAYWNNKEAGIYVDIVSGEPLFSSLDKFDSGTGWPSFTKPIDRQNVTYRTDNKLRMERTEVRSKSGDSHLGHVFNDGPGPEGTRYCMNSASLRFIPVNKLEEEGYGEYLQLFEDAQAVKQEIATLAGGCFWGMEELLHSLPGVLSTRVGYTGGHVEDATYKDVSTGSSGHAEAVEITFDPNKISYGEILDFFFRIHDPTTLNRQGNDKGTQYRSQIFFHSEEQRKEAELAIERATKSTRWTNPIVTALSPASDFFEAEEYHQDYLQKNPGGYSCHFVRE